MGAETRPILSSTAPREAVGSAGGAGKV